MKKTFTHLGMLLLAALMLLPTVATSQQTTVTIGNWSSTTKNNVTFSNNYYKNSYNQTLYSSAEVGDAGYIRAMILDNRSTGAVTHDTICVWLGHASVTTFASTTAWIPESQLTLVYSGSNFTIPAENGEFPIVFNTPFQYDGTSNLVVVVAKRSSTYNTNTQFAYTSTTNAALYRQNDSDTSYFHAPSSSTTGTRGVYKGNLKLIKTPTATESLCMNIAGLRVSSVDVGSITVQWDELVGATYEVACEELSLNPTSASVIAESVSGTSHTFTNLSPNTTYRVFARALCGGETPSGWDSLTVATTPEPVSLPFLTDFEDDNDDAQWTLRNYDATHNQWCIGGAAYAGSDEEGRSLYITNNTTTLANAYSNTTVRVFAAMLLNFSDEGSYDVSYDWRCQGSTTVAYMRAMLIPASQWDNYTAATSTMTGLSASAVPAGVIAVDGGSKLNLQSTWQHFATTAVVPDAGNYYLAFYWVNSTTAAANPPAAVDNISVQASTCYAPAAVTATDITRASTTLNVNHDEATTFMLLLRARGDEAYDTVNIGSTHDLQGLRFGTTYEGMVYTLCGDDTSNTATEFSFTTSCIELTETELPYFEDFESYGTGTSQAISPCWHKGVFGSTTSYPYPYSTAAINGQRGLYFYSIKTSSTSSASWVALPAIDETLDVRDLMVEFLMKRSSSATNTSTTTNSCRVMVGLADSLAFASAEDVDTLVDWIDTLDMSTEPASAISHQEVSFAGYNGTGRYVVFYVPTPQQQTSSNYTTVYLDDINLMLIPSCYKPVELVASNRSHEEVILNWTPDERTANPTAWVVEYGPAGFTPGEGTEESVTDTFVTVTGLNPNTEYDFYVVANCGNAVSDARLLSVTTHCSPIVALPYSEDFEAYASGATNPIDPCWTKDHIGGTTNYPYPYSTSAINGERSLYFYSFTPSSTSTTAPYYCYAALPAFSASVNQLGLSFNMKRYTGSTATYFSQLVVGVMENADDISTFDTVQVFDLTDEEPSTVENLYVDFGEYEGDGLYIALVAPCPPESTAARYNVFYIDDVIVDMTPGCPRAQGISVNGITQGSATIVVSDSNDVGNYIVTVKNLDDTMEADIVETFSDSTYTITDLMPNTQYRISMVTDCDDGTYTIPFEIEFRTACTPIATEDLPYIEDFETYSTGAANPISPCWTKGVMGSTTQYPYPYSTAAIHGSMGLYFYSTSALNCYAALPLFEEPLGNLQVSFSVKHSSTASYKLQFYLGVMSDPNDLSTFDTLQFVDLSTEPASSTHRLNFSLFGYVGQGNMAILLPRMTSSSTYNTVYLDSIVVELLPNCVWPENLVASGIGSDNVTLNWMGNADSYEVEYADNAAFTGASTVVANDTTVTIGNLNDYTAYWFRVRGICGSTDTSDWSATLQAITNVDCGGDDNINIIDTIGRGTSTGYTYAFYSYSSYPRAFTTSLFTAQELMDMGLLSNNRINGIKLHSGSTGGTIRKAKIYVAETTLDAFGTPVANDTVDRNTMTLVYSGDLEVAPNSWVDIPFNAPFNYSGASNLLISFVRDSVATANVTFYYTSTSPDYRSAYFYVSSTGTTYGSGTRTYSRPNVVFNICTEVPTCMRPSEVSVPECTDTMATITWTGNSQSYEFLLSTAAVNPDTLDNPAFITVSDDSITLNGLSASTTYYVYVRGVCGNDRSDWSMEASFQTKCAPMPLPYSEDFEAYSSGSSYPINLCWTKGTNSATAYPYPYSTNAVNGSRSLYFYGQRTSTAATYSYAALPLFEDSVKNLSLSFSVRRYNSTVASNTTRLVIGVMANPGDIATFEPMDTLDLHDETPGSIHGYEYFFNNYTGNGRYIAIYSGDLPLYGTATTTTNYAYVDDILVDRIPSCMRPGNVTVSAITQTSATVHWSGSAPAYEVEYGPRGYNHVRGVTLNTTADSMVLTGLVNSTEYDVYVRGVCEGDDYSVWSFTQTFATECGPNPLPMVFDPDNYATGTTAALPICWTRTNNATGTTNYYPYINSSSTNAHTGSNTLYFYVTGTAGYANDEIMAFPEIDTVNFPMNRVEVSLWAKASYNNRPLVVGVMTDPADMSTFQPVDTMRLTTTSTEYTVGFDGFTGNGAYVALRTWRDSTVSVYLYVDDIRIGQISACPRAYDLVAEDATQNSVVLRWSDTIGSTSWVVSYKADTSDTWIEATATTNPYTLYNLDVSTCYSYRVAPMCADGERADWSRETMSFCTSQVPATVPYSYDFEDAAEWQNWQTASNNTVGWYRGSVAQYNNTNAAYLSADGGATHSWNMLSVTNAVMYRDIDFGPVEHSYQLTFDVYLGGTIGHSYDGVSVILTDPTQPVVPVSTNITSPWGHVNDVALATVRHDTLWGTTTVFLDNVSGIKRLAFYHFNQATGTNYEYENNPSAIDNISLTLMACERPADLAVVSYDTIRATLTWHGDDTSRYVVAYRVRGAAVSTNRYDTVTGNTYTATGLTANTDYYWWVSRICSLTAADTNISPWSSVGTFSTACAVVSVADTLHEGFENVEGVIYSSPGSLPACWKSWNTSTNTSPVYPHVTNTGSYSYWIEGSQALTMTAGLATNAYGNNSFVRLVDIAEPTSSLTMSFWMCTESSSSGYLEVGYLTGSDYERDFVPVKHIAASTATAHSGDGLQTNHGIYDTVSFASAPAGRYPIVFKWTYTTSFYSVSIDDVYIWTSAEPCDMPEDPATVATHNSIALSWSGVADSFEVAIIEGEWREPTGGVIVTGNNYTFNGLTPSTAYIVCVRSLCPMGMMSEWVAVSVLTDQQPCHVPTALAVSSIDYTSAVVTFTPGTEQNAWELHVTGPSFDRYDTIASATHTLSGLAPAMAYQVAVRALCGEQLASAWSDTVTFSTLSCDVVQGVTVTDITGTTARVSWTATGAASYIVSYGYQGSSQNEGIQVTASTNSVVLTGLDNETSYDVYVRSVCADGIMSVWSSVANFTTTSGSGPEPTYYTITVLANNNDWGTVSGGGSFLENTTTTISATANQGYHFVQWQDGNTDNPRTITVTADMTYTATFADGVGIDEVSLDEVSLYPNPATSTVTVRANGMEQVSIIDLNGRTVMTQRVNTETATFDLSALAKGTYFVRIVGEQAAAVRKLVVK